MIRTLFFIGIILVAAVGPIVWSQWKSGDLPTVFNRWTGESPQTSPEPDDGETRRIFQLDPKTKQMMQPSENERQLASRIRVIAIPEALRFDITPSFVSQRWPRVSTRLTTFGLSGMRVPLLTGTGSQDLHGSISYFFNRSGKLQRIKLEAYCGDAAPTVQFVQNAFRLTRYASAGPEIYMSQMGQQPLSLLQVRNAPILANENSHEQKEIFLELNAPLPGASLSHESMKRLRDMRKANLL